MLKRFALAVAALGLAAGMTAGVSGSAAAAPGTVGAQHHVAAQPLYLGDSGWD